MVDRTRTRSRSPAIWPFFFISGAVLGTWSADIPAVRDHLDLSSAAMSGLILMMGVATVCAGLATGQLLLRFSTARTVRIGALLTPLAGAAAIAAPSVYLLAPALLAFGATYAMLDVSMNAHGVAIEARRGVAILSSLHGGWSVGALVGAALVAAAHLLGVDHRLEAAVFASGLVVLGAWFGGGLQAFRDRRRARSADGEPRRNLVLPVGGVILIGCMALLVYSVEGVVLDWGGLYVVQETTGGAALAAAGVAAFSAGMAIGRLVGDASNRAFGAAGLLQLGMATVAVALLAQALIGTAALVVPTLFLTGLGAANSAPLLLSAAGRSGDMPAGAAIAATTMMGDLGLLFVSPLLGAAAQFSSYSVTLACAGACGAVGAVAARRVLVSGAGRAAAVPGSDG